MSFLDRKKRGGGVDICLRYQDMLIHCMLGVFINGTCLTRLVIDKGDFSLWFYEKRDVYSKFLK